MERDIRLYVYNHGNLSKVDKYLRLKHKFKSVESCEEAINTYKLSKQTWQFVIVEYFGVTHSLIIKTINKSYGAS